MASRFSIQRLLLRFVDDPRTALHHLVVVRQAIKRFGSPQKQVTTRLQHGMNAREDFFTSAEK